MTTSKKNEKDRNEPLVYSNYRAFQNNEGKHSTIEFPLFSDAQFRGEFVSSDCPYYFYNLIYSRPGAKIILRADIYLPPSMNMKIESNSDYYCDAFFPHDLVAICSLILGVRLKAGGRTREFRYGEDPLGRPTNRSSIREEQSVIELDKIVLNNCHLMPGIVFNVGNLEELKLLISIKKLSLQEMTALIRSARLYQDAIWLGESEPQRAWILLVSALENCAKKWKNPNYSPIDGLKETYPSLSEYLQNNGGEEHLQRVADYLSDRFKLAHNFVEFIIEFFAKSPDSHLLSNYTTQQMKKIFKKIYSYRSKALHAGTPFPIPMCEPPPQTYDNNGNKVFSEKGMVSRAFHTPEGSWLPEDTPLNLNAFAIITRRVILEWWESLLIEQY